MVFREAKRQGVQHMIATHAFDLAGKMTVEQMQEAAKLGAFIEFDFRNTLEGGRTDAIRKVGPQYCFLSEFWTKAGPPREYGGLDGVGAFAEAMRAHGFTDKELDLMFKENPAPMLGCRKSERARSPHLAHRRNRQGDRRDRCAGPVQPAVPNPSEVRTKAQTTKRRKFISGGESESVRRKSNRCSNGRRKKSGAPRNACAGSKHLSTRFTAIRQVDCCSYLVRALLVYSVLTASTSNYEGNICQRDGQNKKDAERGPARLSVLARLQVWLDVGMPWGLGRWSTHILNQPIGFSR